MSANVIQDQGETPVKESNNDADAVAAQTTDSPESNDATDAAETPTDESSQDQGQGNDKLLKALKREREENRNLKAQVKELETKFLNEETHKLVEKYDLSEASAKILEKFPNIEDRREVASSLKGKNAHSQGINGMIVGQAARPYIQETISKTTIHDDIPMMRKRRT